MEDQTFLSAANVGWEVDEKRILDQVSVSLRANEFFVIMGANGCGKTSLMKILAGLVYPSAGSVQVFLKPGHGMEMHEAVDDRRINAAFVFEAGGLISNLNVFDNVALPLRYLREMPEAQVKKAVQAVLDEYDIAACADMRPGNLSPGLQKRTQLARSKVIKPSIIFYDDPEYGLDAMQTHIIRESIVRLHKEGGRVSVVATGSPGWALGVANRLALLNQGRLEAVGTCDELMNHPSQHVRDFLKTKPL